MLADQNKADWSYDENTVINIYDDANFEDANFEDGRLHMTFEQFFKLAQIAREEGLEIHSPFERAGATKSARYIAKWILRNKKH
ncbi:TPA: hypothetical protein ACJXQR_001760 [Streptococcus pneumoniae]